MAISTDTDRVRLLISDVGGESGTDFLFTNNEVQEFLNLRGGNVFRAAALALRTIAGNTAQVMKRIKFLELDADGPAVAKELRAQAAELDDTADAEGDGDIGIIEMDLTPSTHRELRRRVL